MRSMIFWLLNQLHIPGTWPHEDDNAPWDEPVFAQTNVYSNFRDV